MKNKKSSQSKDTFDDSDAWARIIRSTGRRMRDRTRQIKKDNVTRGNVLKKIPDAVFSKEAAGVDSVPENLKELIKYGAESGMSECPDQLTVALARAAFHWYKKAGGK